MPASPWLTEEARDKDAERDSANEAMEERLEDNTTEADWTSPEMPWLTVESKVRDDESV
jgi:hypothetical protein